MSMNDAIIDAAIAQFCRESAKRRRMRSTKSLYQSLTRTCDWRDWRELQRRALAGDPFAVLVTGPDPAM